MAAAARHRIDRAGQPCDSFSSKVKLSAGVVCLVVGDQNRALVLRLVAIVSARQCTSSSTRWGPRPRVWRGRVCAENLVFFVILLLPRAEPVMGATLELVSRSQEYLHGLAGFWDLDRGSKFTRDSP